MNLRLITLVCLCTTFVANATMASAELDSPVEDHRTTDGLVEYHYPIEVTASYKQRRQDHGFMFAVGYENVIFDRYVSIIDFTTFYQQMFGESEFPVVNVDFSYKFNFSLGSLIATGGLGVGSISDDASGTASSLNITKMRASASYILDSIFDEPYVAPYVTGGYMNLGLEEKIGPTTQKHAVNAMFYQLGLLFQLDWLDPSISKKNIVDYGLQNTYLDVFMTKYEPSANAIDPDTSTDYIYGAGLRLEY